MLPVPSLQTDLVGVGQFETNFTTGQFLLNVILKKKKKAIHL